MSDIPDFMREFDTNTDYGFTPVSTKPAEESTPSVGKEDLNTTNLEQRRRVLTPGVAPRHPYSGSPRRSLASEGCQVRSAHLAPTTGLASSPRSLVVPGGLRRLRILPKGASPGPPLLVYIAQCTPVAIVGVAFTIVIVASFAMVQAVVAVARTVVVVSNEEVRTRASHRGAAGRVKRGLPSRCRVE